MYKTRKILRSFTVSIALSIGVFGLVLNTNAANAANGEVIVNKWGNDLPASGNCGTSNIEFYNASSAPVFKVRVLYDTFYDGQNSNATKPYRNGKKYQSWVTFKMYLKPGKTALFKKSLCTNVPYINQTYSWQSDGRSFKPIAILWTWA
jgi:hypothetical protein